MNKFKERGQVALIVLLILTISLTIGLSLLSRTINELRATSNAEKSAQAYAAAEAGIEEAILKQNNITHNIPQSVNLGVNKEATYKITSSGTHGGNDQAYVFPNQLSKDESAQLWLFNYNSFVESDTLEWMSYSTGHQIRIYWGSPSQIEHETPMTIPALEVTMITAEPSGSDLTNFDLSKSAFDPVQTATDSGKSRGRDYNNFLAPDGVGDFNIAGVAFRYYTNIGLPSGSTRPLMLRIKPLYNNRRHPIAVDPNPPGHTGASLPPQGSVVDSEGSSGNVVRKLRVYQSYPSLPGIFDFALYNGSSTPLQK